MKQPQDGLNMKCKIHPEYKAKRKPTSKKHECTCASIWKDKEQRLSYLEQFHAMVINAIQNKVEFINQWVPSYTNKKDNEIEISRYMYILAEELCKADLRKKDVNHDIVMEWLNRGNL